jgi:methyltransferase-like protein
MSDQPPHNTYDEVPYPSQPFAQTHPNHLATMATLFGLKPPPIERCRVLELGSANGSNIIPMAFALPESTFVGVDLSERQVAQGRQWVAQLGLKNLELRHASILDVDESWGKFDYVLSHGVYSWVPPNVQDKMLDVVANNLAPDGIGYVSYNTYPGWHMRGMIRDMMCYHVERFRGQPAATRVSQARALLDFLARSVTGDKNPYGLMLKNELETLRKQADSYLFHDHLEEHNQPIYFFEFNRRLTAKNLRYLGDTDFSVMVHTNMPPDVHQVLTKLAPSLIQMEQYLDFLRNRTFRQTLIVHEHHRPNYNLAPEHVLPFQVASPLRPKSLQPDLTSTQQESFAGPTGLGLNVSEPLVKAALVVLAEQWPRAVPFEDLRRLARARLGAPDADDPALVARDRLELGRAVLTAYAGAAGTLLELRLWQPPFVTRVSERPEASALARLQAAEGPRVTNQRHQTVAISEFDRHLLPYLDGSRPHSTLLRVLMEQFQQGALKVNRAGQPITNEHEARPIMAQSLAEQLPRLAAVALLVA